MTCTFSPQAKIEYTKLARWRLQVQAPDRTLHVLQSQPEVLSFHLYHGQMYSQVGPYNASS